MPQETTIKIKGTKKVKISTFGNEKNRVPVILSIARNGDKLAHMMIFKGQPDKTIEKHLQKIDDIINKKIFVYCQQN
jgi:glutaredoxin 2